MLSTLGENFAYPLKNVLDNLIKVETSLKQMNSLLVFLQSYAKKRFQIRDSFVAFSR